MHNTGYIEPKDNRACFARKSYLAMFTEPEKLCQRDVTLTLVILNTAYLQMDTTCYTRDLSIKLDKCNPNFATWPFPYQK